MTDKENICVGSNWHQTVLPILVTLVAVGILVVMGYSGYQSLIEKIGDAEGQAEKALVEVNQAQDRLDKAQGVVGDLQLGVQEANLSNARDWSPIVIEHLVRMADLTLNTTGDVKLAISFLSAAQEYAKSPELSAINHALNKDIARLQAVPLFDPSDLIFKLEVLSRKVDSLPLVVEKFSKQKEGVLKEKQTGDKIWKRIFNSSMEGLRGIVSIRRQATEPLLVPEQETILRLNIQAKLLQAEFAVMQRQNDLYQICLEGVSNLVARYFVANSNIAEEILSTLKELQLVNLQPKLPFPTGSVSAVMDFVSANKKQEIRAKTSIKKSGLQNKETKLQ